MTQSSADRIETGRGSPDTPAFRRTGGNAPGWIENAPRKGWFPDLDLAEVWAGREIAAVLALRNIKIRYKQTFFGVGWAILQPLAGVAIFTLVFGRLAQVPSEGIPYPVFVFAGLAVVVLHGVRQRRHREPRRLPGADHEGVLPAAARPLAAVIPPLVDVGVQLVAVAIFMAIWASLRQMRSCSYRSGCWPRLSSRFGVGAWLAALNVKYRDVRNAITFLLQVWFFATPVVYGSSLLPSGPDRRQPDGRPRRRVPVVADRRAATGAEAVVSLIVGLLVVSGASWPTSPARSTTSPT